MPKTERLKLKDAPRCRSKEIALQLGSLDDMLYRLFEEDLAGVTKQELEWQPAPGHNTIGMLLAHFAIVEVHWTQLAIERIDPSDVGRVIGIGMMDDGMPVPEGGGPPPSLKGKTLPWFRNVLATSRKYVHRKWSRLNDRDLKKQFKRTKRNGQLQVTDPRWVMYHLVEHFAGHQGQILLIRHQYRDFRASR